MEHEDRVVTTSPPGLERSLDLLDRTTARLAGIRPAGEVLGGVGPRRFLHSGPPLELDEVPGPMRGAILGALVFQGEASGLDEAGAIVDAGEVELASCHDNGAVGAMAGIVTPRMPGVVVESVGGTVFSPLNEGLGRALRFGSNDESTLARLDWLADVAAPVLDAAIATSEPIELGELVSEGLRRGDECHNRNVATSAMIIARLAAGIVRAAPDADTAAAVFAYAAGNRHFALPFSIAAGKAITDSAHGEQGSPLVTAMAGNGRRFGIRVSGLGDRWFLAPAPLGDARYFEGYTAEDATPTMGDSMITETAGYGAFALTAAPAITSFVGGTVQGSRELVEEMRTICAGTSSRFLVPGDEFRGTPVGIDVDRVREAGVAPIINNGLAHRDPGRGQVGAGITRLPLDPFVEASRLLSENM
jgi:Protein of unknown function (DUF1116)